MVLVVRVARVVMRGLIDGIRMPGGAVALLIIARLIFSRFVGDDPPEVAHVSMLSGRRMRPPMIMTVLEPEGAELSLNFLNVMFELNPLGFPLEVHGELLLNFFVTCSLSNHLLDVFHEATQYPD